MSHIAPWQSQLGQWLEQATTLTFFFPLILRSEQVLEMATSLCAARLGPAPAVACHPSKLLLADAAAQVFRDALQLAQGLGLPTYNLFLSLRPEAEVQAS